MRSFVVVACLLAGCGDNQHGTGVPLAATHDLVVVAHQDDDLLFMQPDLIEAVHRGTGMTNVYITAGNGHKGTGAANPRYTGLMAAYGAVAGDTAWSCGWISIAGHAAQHCRLEAENVSLVFLAYPDGGKFGEGPNSLLKLWQGDIPNATTVADRTAVYDRDGLIATVAAIIEATHPAVVHTLDLTSGHGYDHSDHMITGAITALALARTSAEVELIAYRGYNMVKEPANKPSALFDETRGILGYYEACTAGCAPCGQSCTTVERAHLVWLGRRYALGFRRDVRGRLRTPSGAGCLGGSALVPCDTAPVWTLSGGHLAGAGGCLAVDPTGALAIAPCAPDPTQRFLADDEGRLWSGLPPPFAPNLAYAHLRCVTPRDDGSVTTTTCDNTTNTAPRWQWAPVLAQTPRAQLGFTETGRSVRIGDVTGDGFGDLCAVTAGGLACAPGHGDGTFGTAVRIDDPAAPLAIDPQSLTLGDLDGDGIADACGRDRDGVLCARSSTGFAATRFAPQFGDTDARATTPASLRITEVDGSAEVCGLAAEGVVCTPPGASFATQLRSPWPDPAATVVPADLDADASADWCELADTGPACGLASDRAITTAGVPWGFSLGGVVETAPHDPALADIADIDGDGDGDLCAPVGDGTIACARSTGHGFGPRTVVAVLPDGAQASALWLGDLDGDGRADVCADLGATIACARL
ncbi:MAG: FG-GAP-like repeat-containing protein [Kofleriaceae bacterium]